MPYQGFFDDKNKDGIADGLQVDTNQDGRPDYLEKYLKQLELRFLVSWLLTAIGVLILTLLADYLGRLLGFHS